MLKILSLFQNRLPECPKPMEAWSALEWPDGYLTGRQLQSHCLLSLSLDLFAQSDTGSFIYVQICSWAQQGWCACWISPFWALADYPTTPFGPNRPKPSCPDLLSLRLSLCSLVSHSQLPPLARRHHQPVSSCSTHHFSKNYYITHFMNNGPQRQREKERWGERDRE